MDKPEPHTYEERRVWGRRQNRPLNAQRQDAMDDVFPHVVIPAGDLKEDGTLAPSSLFDDAKPTWMEIGFGGGEHVVGMLGQSDDFNIIAIEPFLNGMAGFLRDLPEENRSRVRVLMDDAMFVASSLSDNSLERIYILNPDPWHKARHHKRRIVNPENLNEFARILKPGGQLIMTSDVPDLAEWMVTHAQNHPEFDWQAESHLDWSVAPEGWMTTRYEVKGAKGAKKMCYLFFERKA